MEICAIGVLEYVRVCARACVCVLVDNELFWLYMTFAFFQVSYIYI